jgi:hypothetical protein
MDPTVKDAVRADFQLQRKGRLAYFFGNASRLEAI